MESNKLLRHFLYAQRVYFYIAFGIIDVLVMFVLLR
jgi:hypothetical protein